MSELKAKSITPDGPRNLYLKSEVDAVLAKKDMEIFNLKEELSYIKADSAFDRDKHKELLKSKDAEIAELKVELAERDKEIAELKRKSLDVKDFAHVLKAYKFYLCQLTHCAFDEPTAQWIVDNWEQDYERVEACKG